MSDSDAEDDGAGDGGVQFRQAARVLLLDEGGRTLLIRGSDSTRPDAGSWWFTPGGGLEPGETVREAALREISEETGVVLTDLAGPVHEQTIELVFEGVRLRQHEFFFYAVVGRFPLNVSGRTLLETRTMKEARWWSVDELEATHEVFYPHELPELLRRCV